MIGDFCIVHRIGRGGMGIVYEARKQLLEWGHALALAHLRPQVRRALDTVGLLDTLPVVVTT